MVRLEELLQRLVRQEVEFVLVGGYAAMLYGVSLITKDVDVCVPFHRANLEKIHASLADLHPYHRMTPQAIPFTIPPGFEERLKNLYLATDDGPIDLLGEVLGVGDYASVHAASVLTPSPAANYRILNIDTLIVAKQCIGRDRDKVAVLQLRSIRDSARPKDQSSTHA